MIKNIRIIEDRLDVKITARYDELHIRGFEKKADIAVDIIKKLMTIIQGGELITEQNIRYLLDMTEEERQSFRNIPMDQICVTYRGRPIKIKTFGQKSMLML